MKRKSYKKEYILLTFNSNTVIDFNNLSSLFGYEAKRIGSGSTLEVGWKQAWIKMIIDDILNNSNSELISVSEDEKNIRYHFIRYYNE